MEIAKAMTTALRGKRPAFPDDAAWQALADGDLDLATARATQPLASAAAEEIDWFPDDQRHAAHTILGHVHLRRGDLDLAQAELLRSADVEETPVLGSFAPDLGLAWQLLLAGRADAVAEFAQQFGRFWNVHSRADDYTPSPDKGVDGHPSLPL